nr:uncharacterized protein LOC107380971 isoform X2 [Nothobranchius furzeri]
MYLSVVCLPPLSPKEEEEMSSHSNSRPNMPWSNGEVKTFLSLVAEERIQGELDGAARNEKIFLELAEAMATHGFTRSSKQCRDKLKKLKCEYRAVAVHNGRRGVDKRRWKWFKEMDAIYGKRPASSVRESVVDSAGPSPVSSCTSGNGQSLRELISERLAAAAADIFSEFEKTIARYEKEIDRQRRLLEVNSARTELPLHYIKKDEEVLTDQQLWNQERTSSLDQEQAEPLHEVPEPQQIKVEQDNPEHLPFIEQEELCISQDEEQFVVKLENVTSFSTPIDEERNHDGPEPSSEQRFSSVFPEAEVRDASPAASSGVCFLCLCVLVMETLALKKKTKKKTMMNKSLLLDLQKEEKNNNTQ